MKFKKPATPTHGDLQKLLAVALFIPFLGIAASYRLHQGEVLGNVTPTFQAVLFLVLLVPLAYAVRLVVKCKATKVSAQAYGFVALVASIEMVYLFSIVAKLRHSLAAGVIDGIPVTEASIYLLGYGAMVACTLITLVFQYFWVYKPGRLNKSRFADSPA